MYPRAALNRLYTNVGLVPPLLQCEENGTCEEMAAELPFLPELGIWGVERGKWKYVLDLGESPPSSNFQCGRLRRETDGNGHSADFQKSLGLGRSMHSVFNSDSCSPVMCRLCSVVFKSSIFSQWNADWWATLVAVVRFVKR